MGELVSDFHPCANCAPGRAELWETVTGAAQLAATRNMLLTAAEHASDEAGCEQYQPTGDADSDPSEFDFDNPDQLHNFESAGLCGIRIARGVCRLWRYNETSHTLDAK